MISCGARLAVFDIAELREVTSYDELELDTLGDRKTALFLIIQLAFLKQLLERKLITDREYSLIKQRLMKDYRVVSELSS